MVDQNNQSILLFLLRLGNKRIFIRSLLVLKLDKE